MADSKIQDTTDPVVTAATASEQAPGTYRMSREGRRQAIILLLGVISIWIFALWTLVAGFEGGLSGVEWISSLLMLGILIVSPVVAWTLLEEANSRIEVDDAGLTYQTLGGINLHYAWNDISGVKRKGKRGRWARFFLGEDDSNEQPAAPVAPTITVADETDDDAEPPEPETMLLAVKNDHSDQIANPLLRFLHRQAHGSSLPVYGGLENRGALLQAITARLGSL